MIKRANDPSKRDRGSDSYLEQFDSLQTPPQGKQTLATPAGSFGQSEGEVSEKLKDFGFLVKDIREAKVKFAVDEIDPTSFEYGEVLCKRPQEVTEEISDIRNYIDGTDVKIFRGSELLRENP